MWPNHLGDIFQKKMRPTPKNRPNGEISPNLVALSAGQGGQRTATVSPEPRMWANGIKSIVCL
jgi:hypothetical protein